MLDHLLRADPGAEAALLALNTHGDGTNDVVGTGAVRGGVGRQKRRGGRRCRQTPGDAAGLPRDCCRIWRKWPPAQV